MKQNLIHHISANPKHKMSYHHHNKNRNAENASYTHAQRDAVRTVTLNAPPRSRPTSGSYNKADVNKDPKLNLCPGEALYRCGSLLTALRLRGGFPPWGTDLPSSLSLLFLGQHHCNIFNSSQRILSMSSRAHDLKAVGEYTGWALMG